jgi:hypothetical protein
MAYMNQEKKKILKAGIDKVLKPLGFKYSVGVNNHSTIVLNIWKGPVDFISIYKEKVLDEHPEFGAWEPDNYINVNPYHYERSFSGQALDIISHLMTELNKLNYDRSDIQTDYFDVGYYVDINIGNWNKPYEYVA